MSPNHIHVEKTIGDGAEQVYCFYYPSQVQRVLGMIMPSPMKIGAAAGGDALQRIRVLTCGSHEDPVVALVICCDDALFVEKALHHRFAEQRIRREWFTLTPDDVEEAWMTLGQPEHATLGEMLRFYRRRRGWSQTELAQAAGERQEMVSRIESGHDGVALKTVVNLAGELGMDLRMVPRG